MSILDASLSSLAFGAPQRHQNLTLVPLIAAEAHLADYLTLDEAIAARLAEVTELSDSGTVPELRFRNRSDRDVLLLMGEELVGAKQNRVLNVTIMVAGGQEIVIPVSCVEAGRWGYRSREFRTADRAMYAGSEEAGKRNALFLGAPRREGGRDGRANEAHHLSLFARERSPEAGEGYAATSSNTT